MPELKNKARDFFYLGRRDPAKTVETVVELCKTRLPQNMGIPPEQIQVLTPTRKRGAGTAALNRAAVYSTPRASREGGTSLRAKITARYSLPWALWTHRELGA